MARERLVVVGNGMVGLRLVEAVRAAAPDRFDLTVVGEEPEPAYNRVLLSSVLAGEVADADARLRDRPWYLRQGVRLITGHPATTIDRERREVAVGHITTLPYDRLVLATGSDAIRLPLPGIGLAGVHVFRTTADVARIRAGAAPGGRAVVIGGGLLGLEAANGVARAGMAVTVVHLADRLMERQLDGAAAALIQDAMAARGIAFRLAADTAAIEGQDRVAAVRLASGERIAADLVVVAAGVRPRVDLAREAGLAVGRGIRVDDGLATSDPAIHALGECAEHRGTCHGLVEPGYEQAAVLAARLAGRDAHYPGSVTAAGLKVSGVPVFAAGPVDPPEGAAVVTLRDPGLGTYRRLVVAGDRLVGCILVGDIADGPWYLDLLRRGRSVAAIRADLAFGQALAEAVPTLADAA